MIDTHAHLSDPKLKNDLPDILQRAGKAEVTTIISPSVNLADTIQVDRLTQENTNIYGLGGIYPGEAEGKINWKSQWEEIARMIKANNKLVGVGEIGLDRESYEKNPKLEEELFVTQLEWAMENQRPVVIHVRETQEPMRQVLERYATLPAGQFHCFGGDVEWLEYVLARGFLVGFDGNVTYPSAEGLRQLVKLVPKNRLLLETDSPYLPPEGKRGQRNEPANVRITAAYIANLRGEPLSELINYTTQNAKKLFGLQ